MVRVMSQKRRGQATFYGAIFVGALITVGVVMWGRADQGQIDVPATINVANEEIKKEGGSEVRSSRNPYSDKPNGGLVGAGKSTPPPEPEVTEETSSTTPESTGEETQDVSEETPGDTTE